MIENDCNKALLSLLKPFLVSKGSLRYEELPELPLVSDISPSTIDFINQSCKLVSPIKEDCLNSDEHGAIDSLLKEILGNTYKRTMLLYCWSSAAYIGGALYGSINSIHFNSAMIYAKSTEHGSFLPGMSCKFLKINIILDTPNDGDQGMQIYLCGLNWLQEHPHKNWFHPPVEVWRRIIPQSFMQPNHFVPTSCIACRCAHTLKFTRELEETVTIVTPFQGLNDFYYNNINA